MATLSEKQRLLLTIGAAVVVTGGITAMVFADRGEIEDTEAEIAVLDERIQSADAEIRKTRDREDDVIVFRGVRDRELEILPRHQEIAEFQANLTAFFSQAGARFVKLPENAPKESEVAPGVYVTPNALECEADAPSLLRLVNMIEIDPRLVAVKGLKVKAGSTTGPRPKDGDEKPLHKVSLALETYYYNPAASAKRPAVAIPNEAERREEPKIAQRIAEFTPEKRDSYTLRASTSRRDPFVDVRREVIKEDPEKLRARLAEETGRVEAFEKRLDEAREKVEQEKAFVLEHKIFEADRIARDVNVLLNELSVQLAATTNLKNVTFPELLSRVDRVRAVLESVSAARRDLPRELRVTASVAKEVRGQIDAAFRKGDYAEVNSLCVAWESFVRGKEVEPAAVSMIEQMKDYRRRGKVLSEFHAKVIHVVGVMVNGDNPASSAAIVNKGVLRIGESLDGKGDVKVVAIRRDGVEFAYEGEVVFVPREDAAAIPDARSQAVSAPR